MAKAEMLRDQDKFKAARDAENRAIELRVKGAELTKIGSDIEARKQLLPAQIANINAQAAAYGLRGAPKPPTSDEFMNARISLAGRNIKPPYSPEQLNQEVMRLRGVKVENSAATSSGDYSALMGT
jgi:hypothetical protein